MHYSIDLVREIARKHELSGEPRVLPTSGMVNEAWLIGDEFVLRIAVAPDCDGEAEREAAVVPVVRAAGVRSPELVAFDLSCQLAPRPYTLYRRASGVLLGHFDDGPEGFDALCLELGREIARLGRINVTPELRALLHDGTPLQAREQLQKARDAGVVSNDECRQTERCLDALEQRFDAVPAPRFMHMDLHPWNLFADPKTHELTAIIDWGDASFGDPAIEFSSMPMALVPKMLEGYREEGEAVDESFVARSMYAGLALGLWELRDGEMQSFARHWWRMPLGGIKDALARVDRTLELATKA